MSRKRSAPEIVRDNVDKDDSFDESFPSIHEEELDENSVIVYSSHPTHTDPKDHNTSPTRLIEYAKGNMRIGGQDMSRIARHISETVSDDTVSQPGEILKNLQHANQFTFSP